MSEYFLQSQVQVCIYFNLCLVPHDTHITEEMEQAPDHHGWLMIPKEDPIIVVSS